MIEAPEFSGYLDMKTRVPYMKLGTWKTREEARPILKDNTDAMFDHVEKMLWWGLPTSTEIAVT